MTLFLIVFVAALSAVMIFLVAGRRHRAQLRSIEDFRARWQKVDIEAFANLVDPSEERFLQENLPPREFRTIQRQRLRAAWEYLARVGQNAQLMVQAGQIIQQHNTGSEAVRARLHVESAMRLRTQVFLAQCALAMQFAAPSSDKRLEKVLRLYGDAAHSFDNVLDPGVTPVTM